MTKKIKASLILGTATLGLIATPVLVTSCSSDSSTKLQAETQKFETKVTLSKTAKTATIPTEGNVFDGEYNVNAQKQLEQFAKELTVKALQYDFDKVLTDFYEVYEIETEDTEVELEKIQVIEKNKDNSFKLEVSYSIETESERDKETIKKIIIPIWNPNFVLLSKDKIDELKSKILANQDPTGNIDLSDLKEIFFGEKDNDEDDDLGIFDLIAKENKNYDNLASLVSYNLTLNDIFGPILKTLNQKTIVALDTQFTVPSISFNNRAAILVPSQKPTIDYTIDPAYSKPATELDTIFGTTTEKTGAEAYDFLNEILLNFGLDSTTNPTPDAAAKVKYLNDLKINKIILFKSKLESSDTSLMSETYNVAIEFKEIKKAPDIIVIPPKKTN